jgi:hypothetical protein
MFSKRVMGEKVSNKKVGRMDARTRVVGIDGVSDGWRVNVREGGGTGRCT